MTHPNNKITNEFTGFPTGIPNVVRMANPTTAHFTRMHRNSFVEGVLIPVNFKSNILFGDLSHSH